MHESSSSVGGRAREAAGRVLGERRGTVPGKAGGEAYAPANIALVKYWGKRDEELKLPVAGSLSVSLGEWGTRTRVSRREDGSGDRVRLNGKELPGDSGFARRVSAFLDLTRPRGDFSVEVVTENTVPTAAGLASSASGFAALAGALDDWFGWGLSERERSVLARLGSGSACRSVGQGFYEWLAGTEEGGGDSYARRVEADWPEFRVGAVVVDAGEKPVGSGEGMRRAVESCPLFGGWKATVERDLAGMKAGLAARDWAAVGGIAEGNAMAMHGLMWATRPPVVYTQAGTLEAMRKVWAARAEGVGVWFTMDAGPNVKLLFDAADEGKVRGWFPEMNVVRGGGASAPR